VGCCAGAGRQVADQVPLVLAAKEEHLVGVPPPTERATVLASFGGQLRPECLDPAQARCGWTRRCRGRPAAPSRSWRTVGGAGTSARPSGSRRLASGNPKRPRRPKREVPPTVCAGEALATVAVMAITCDDDLLAVRTGGHVGRRYQHQTTSQTQNRRLTQSTGPPLGRSMLRISGRWQSLLDEHLADHPRVR
jgi:hypothetical protein